MLALTFINSIKTAVCFSLAFFLVLWVVGISFSADMSNQIDCADKSA